MIPWVLAVIVGLVLWFVIFHEFENRRMENDRLKQELEDALNYREEDDLDNEIDPQTQLENFRKLKELGLERYEEYRKQQQENE